MKMQNREIDRYYIRNLIVEIYGPQLLASITTEDLSTLTSVNTHFVCSRLNNPM
jgi:hypothetical protein